MVTGTMEFWMTFHSYWEIGMSSSQLTNSIIFQRGRWLNQQQTGWNSSSNIWDPEIERLPLVRYNLYHIIVEDHHGSTLLFHLEVHLEVQLLLIQDVNPASKEELPFLVRPVPFVGFSAIQMAIPAIPTTRKTTQFFRATTHCNYFLFWFNISREPPKKGIWPETPQTNSWLVVWNILYFSICWECHHPNWRSHIFQRARYTTSKIQFHGLHFTSARKYGCFFVFGCR